MRYEAKAAEAGHSDASIEARRHELMLSDP
jgi:hypothetical protein